MPFYNFLYLARALKIPRTKKAASNGVVPVSTNIKLRYA